MRLRKSTRSNISKSNSFYENQNYFDENSRDSIDQKVYTENSEIKSELQIFYSKPQSFKKKIHKKQKKNYKNHHDEDFFEVCSGFYDLIMEINQKCKNLTKKHEKKSSPDLNLKKIKSNPGNSPKKLILNPIINSLLNKEKESDSTSTNKKMIDFLNSKSIIPPLKSQTEISNVLNQYLRKSSVLIDYLQNKSIISNLNFPSIFNFNENHNNQKIANMEFILMMLKNDSFFPNIPLQKEKNFSLLSFLTTMQSEISNYLFGIGMNAKKNINEDSHLEMEKINKILQNMKLFDEQIKQENMISENELKKTNIIIKNEDKNKLLPPFKRAGTHVAIAYYIYVSKNKNPNKDELSFTDPTYNSRLLKEKTNNKTSSSKTETCIDILEKIEEREHKNEIFSSAKKKLLFDHDEESNIKKNNFSLFSNTQSPFKSNFKVVSQKNSPNLKSFNSENNIEIEQLPKLSVETYASSQKVKKIKIKHIIKTIMKRKKEADFCERNSENNFFGEKKYRKKLLKNLRFFKKKKTIEK